MIALTIGGSDSGGGAGIQADLKTFAALGVHGTCVVTSMTAQNTLEVKEVLDLPLKFIKSQFDAIHEDFDVKAAKTGMLSKKEIVETVADCLGDYPLVVDPVMAAKSGYKLLDEDAIKVLKDKLFPRATLVTPNIPEAEVLAGIKIENTEDMKDACRIISKKGCSVIVKGGHSDAVDVLYHEKFYELKGRKYAYETHGTGCTFASAITAELAKGKNLLNAVKKAKDFVDLAIKASYKPGKGPRVAFQDINAQKHRVESRLKKVVEKIEKNFYTLIPEVGTNFVYALSWASDPKDVVAIEGRIVKLKNRSKAVGGITFGGSKHVAAIVLTAMKFDSSIRSGINIKYTEHILNACEKAGLKISKFSREKEPKGVKSMEWGTAECIKAFGSVPDVIYDLGAVGKEPMIRILGKNPEDVYKKIKKILKAYSVK